jgi:hypothetical protein
MPNSGRPPKIRLRSVRTLKELRQWWNTIVDVKVKAIIITGLVVGFTLAGFQFQLNAQTTARINAICDQRVQSRQDLHDVLYEIVDLSDVLPGVPEAEEYTRNRRLFIDTNYNVDAVKHTSECPGSG